MLPRSMYDCYVVSHAAQGRTPPEHGVTGLKVRVLTRARDGARDRGRRRKKRDNGTPNTEELCTCRYCRHTKSGLARTQCRCLDGLRATVCGLQAAGCSS